MKKINSLLLIFVLSFSMLVFSFNIAPVFAVSETLDFEEGDLSDWTSTTGAGISASADAAHGGSYGCLEDLHATSQQYQMYKDFNESDFCSVEGWIRYIDVGNALIYDQLWNGTSQRAFAALRPNGGTGYFRIGYYDANEGGETWEDTDTTFSNNTWYYFKMEVRIANDTGFVNWFINTEQIASKTELANDEGGERIDRYYTLCQSLSSTPDIHRDDIFISNSLVYNYDVEVTDRENSGAPASGYGSWVFAEWKFYNFEAVYGHVYADDNASEMIDTCWLYMTDGVYSYTVKYDTTLERFYVHNGTGHIALSNGTVTESGQLLYVNFKIMFLSPCIDAMNVSIQMYVDDFEGNFDGWEVMAEDHFNLYVHGGYNELTVSGEAGRVAGGSIFDLYAFNNSYAYVDAYYRNLQHIKIDHLLYIKGVGWQGFQSRYMIDYMTSDGWEDGGYIYLTAESVTAGTVVNINFTVNWGDHNGDILPIDNRTVYMFHKNGGASTGDPTETRYYIDIWFDTQNQSTVMGYRVNAYEFPVKDSADAWLRWLSTDWGADITEKSKDQTMMIPILDDNNETVNAREVLMIRVTHLLQVYGDEYDQYVYAQATQGLALDISPYDSVFEATETPPIDQTQMPAIQQGGWVGVISNGFRWLANIIGDSLGAGLLAALDVFVDAMDSLFAIAGWENGFSSIINWLSSLIGWMIDAMGWFVSLTIEFFDIFNATGSKAVNTASGMLNAWTSMFSHFFGFLDGTYTEGVELWNDLDMGTWVIIAAILYPMYLLIVWDEQGFDKMLNHVQMVLNVAGAVVHFLLTIIQFALDLVFKLIDAIPIVE